MEMPKKFSFSFSFDAIESRIKMTPGIIIQSKPLILASRLTGYALFHIDTKLWKAKFKFENLMETFVTLLVNFTIHYIYWNTHVTTFSDVQGTEIFRFVAFCNVRRVQTLTNESNWEQVETSMNQTRPGYFQCLHQQGDTLNIFKNNSKNFQICNYKCHPLGLHLFTVADSAKIGSVLALIQTLQFYNCLQLGATGNMQKEV